MRARLARRRGVVVEGPVALGRGVRFDVARGARVVLGDGVSLGDGCRLHVAAGAEVRVGAGTVFGERCALIAHERIVIGAGCALADEVVLADADPRYDDPERPVRLQGLAHAPVLLGDGARVGPGAVVRRGVTVGAGASVGAHAVVTTDVPAGGTVAGVPAATAPRPRRAPGAPGPR